MISLTIWFRTRRKKLVNWCESQCNTYGFCQSQFEHIAFSYHLEKTHCYLARYTYLNMEQPGPPNGNDENQELDNRLNEIDIHEVEEDSTDSGEGSIIFVNEDEDRVEELVEADDGVVIDDDNSDNMDIGDVDEMNGYINEDRVGGNHPLIRFSGHTGKRCSISL